MSQIFLSYSSKNEALADRLFQFLKKNRVDVWYAPHEIAPGQSFADGIGTALGHDDTLETLEDQLVRLQGAQIFIILISRSSMMSAWVKKELIYAIQSEKVIIPVQVDRTPLTAQFSYLLSDLQIINGYRLPTPVLQEILRRIRQIIPDAGIQRRQNYPKLTYDQLQVHPIAAGDPYFEDGSSLRVQMSGACFFLLPPEDMLVGEAGQWAAEHLAVQEEVFGEDLAGYCKKIPICDLYERIEQSKRKIFRQFLLQENGCYYNNRKYGVYDILPYARTEDLSETPVLTLSFYTTDYYTHRVMKDVCKTLIKSNSRYFREIVRFTALSYNRIFYTSLGLNLLLLDSTHRQSQMTILTRRSSNAAETYEQEQFSISMIEGVSLSDYDPYQKSVSLTLAALRGLREELGVEAHMLSRDSLHFYDLFVIDSNQEMGLSCSVELLPDFSLQDNVFFCKGKDALLEIASKQLLSVRDELPNYLMNHLDQFLPQAKYTICTYLEAQGVSVLDPYAHTQVTQQEQFICSRNGASKSCGDAIYSGPHFLAVIDAATPKGTKLWDGLPGDQFLSAHLAREMDALSPDCSAEEAITRLNGSIQKVYQRYRLRFTEIPPEERLQASIVIYSVRRAEIWNFGDCKIRINHKNYDNPQRSEQLLSGLRAFCIEAEQLRRANGQSEIPEESLSVWGREQILPYLKTQILFCNTNCSFGYDALNGGPILPQHIQIYSLQQGDHVVLASDGYPVLYDTLEQSEAYLKDALADDPMCIYQLRGTKGLKKGQKSFDDRSFLSFTV